MPTPTPMPTGAQILAAAPLVSGRLSLVQREVVRLLKAGLPLGVAAFNDAWDRGDANKPPVLTCPPADAFKPAPANVNDRFVESVLVGASARLESYTAGAFLTVGNLDVHIVRRRLEAATVERDISDAMDLAGLVFGVLYSSLTHHVTAQGLEVWGQLLPAGVSDLPDEGSWRDYSGKTCHFVFEVPPGSAGWVPAA